MQEVNVYVATAARGPREQEAAYVYLLELKTDRGPVTLTKTGMLQGTKNYIEIKALEMALERVKMRVYLHLYIDSNYVSQAFLQGLPEKWQENGWKTAKGAMVANKAEWEKTLELLYENPYEVHINAEHEYRNWMKREIRKGEKKNV